MNENIDNQVKYIKHLNSFYNSHYSVISSLTITSKLIGVSSPYNAAILAPLSAVMLLAMSNPTAKDGLLSVFRGMDWGRCYWTWVRWNDIRMSAIERSFT
jgi:hypothetical protein